MKCITLCCCGRFNYGFGVLMTFCRSVGVLIAVAAFCTGMESIAFFRTGRRNYLFSVAMTCCFYGFCFGVAALAAFVNLLTVSCAGSGRLTCQLVVVSRTGAKIIKLADKTNIVTTIASTIRIVPCSIFVHMPVIFSATVIIRLRIRPICILDYIPFNIFPNALVFYIRNSYPRQCIRGAF